MSWVNSKKFKLVTRNNRHYVFRRNNSGNVEINIPKNITTKVAAARWLKAHPNKLKAPNRRRRARVRFVLPKAYDPFNTTLVPYETGTSVSPVYPKRAPRLPSPNAYGPVSPTLSPNIRSLPCDKLKAALKQFRQVGSGRQGIVFLASKSKGELFAIKVSPRDLAASNRKEKQPVDIEFNIQKAVQKCSPSVVRVYKNMRCLNFISPSKFDNKNFQNTQKYDKSKQGLIIMEYCEGGDLESWIKKTHQLNDTVMWKLISTVLEALYTIKRKYPYFSHNDLHMKNVFVSSRGFLLGDFGWARLDRMGTNPAVNTANGTSTASYYGVGPRTDRRYDHHLFLNDLRDWALKTPHRFPETIKFLNAAVPPGYRGKNDTHINDWRLMYDDPCPGLPTLAQVMKMPFLKSGLVISSPNLIAARARLRRTGRKLTPRLASLPKVPSPIKKNWTNKQLINMSRANLFRLNNATRIRAIRLRKGVQKVIQKRNNATARVKAGAPIQVINRRKLRSIPRNVLSDPRFTNMWLKIKMNLKPQPLETVYNIETRARNTARDLIRNRLNKGLAPFSASPVARKKTPNLVVVARPRGVMKLAALEHVRTPRTGRIKIKAPTTGRLVYADGASVSIKYLKNLAKMAKVDIKGLRSKADIANKIFRA